MVIIIAILLSLSKVFFFLYPNETGHTKFQDHTGRWFTFTELVVKKFKMLEHWSVGQLKVWCVFIIIFWNVTGNMHLSLCSNKEYIWKVRGSKKFKLPSNEKTLHINASYNFFGT